MDPAAGLDEGQVIRVPSLNQERLKPWHCGLWSETEPPPALRGSLRERYLQAIRHINSVERGSWMKSADNAQTPRSLIMRGLLGIVILVLLKVKITLSNSLFIATWYTLCLRLFVPLWYKRIALSLLQEAVSEGNALLWPDDILIGCESTKELLVARVPLGACREQLGRRFDSALKKYSCVYVCRLAQRCGDPARPPKAPGHLRGQTCFCQYVLKRLS